QKELGSPSGSSGSGQLQGSRVDADGAIHLPLVGSVRVAGQTVGDAQKTLRDAFSAYLKDPSVVVEVAQYRSHPLQLLGQFRNPGTYYMERPLTLLEGLSLGGGLSDIANLRSARLIRDRQTVPVDLYRLLQEGAREQNVWLKPGDTIFVPDDRNQNVFVFGAVEKSGRVSMPNGRLTLTQALASAGLEGARYNPEQVRIIRSLSPTRGELIVVDVKKLIAGEALPFQLMEGDIVYMPRSAVGNWNQAIEEILPSLQLISSVLQPFVQIKFLTEDD
ncbi:MAG: sugar transporter, partial [Desulfuromonadales bacterium]|nr:sugar transporter [Desulfuromonadales bacterium]NIR33266.1 sugar transporter [Desulfuromonadales bacterium]NIS42051.1 sugar transporter [Desulfuromonadales bacterium]